MGFPDLLERARAKNVPVSALLELTYQCNLDCAFCYNDRALGGKPLGLAQYERLLADLRAMGTMNLALSGGEPLAHPEFFAIGSAARREGFVVRIKSNGHGLRPGVLRRIREEIDPYYIEVSLHGARAETHDRQTQVPGSFDRLMENLETMAKGGWRFRLRTPVTRWNESELEGIFAIADRFGVSIDCDPQITPRDDGDPSPLALSPSIRGVQELFRIRDSRRTLGMNWVDSDTEVNAVGDPSQEPSSHCGAGTTSLTVDPMGNVLACVQWRHSLGNLHQQSVREIWETSSELKAVRRKNEEAAAFARSANPAVRRAGFCPASAEQQTGSHVKFYPAVIRSLKGVESLRAGSSAEIGRTGGALEAAPLSSEAGLDAN